LGVKLYKGRGETRLQCWGEGKFENNPASQNMKKKSGGLLERPRRKSKEWQNRKANSSCRQIDGYLRHSQKKGNLMGLGFCGLRRKGLLISMNAVMGGNALGWKIPWWARVNSEAKTPENRDQKRGGKGRGRAPYVPQSRVGKDSNKSNHHQRRKRRKKSIREEVMGGRGTTGEWWNVKSSIENSNQKK